MRLKYLSLCLIGLTLSACSSHVIKTNHNTVNGLEQRAANGLNAMYEYPSYDYNGGFNIAFEKDPDQTNPQNKALDQDIEKQVDRYLSAQKIKLTSQEKQDLYTAIANQNVIPISSKSKGFENFAINFLNSLQFTYDGSVHYKQKMASFNLTAKYEKPTLLVQAKVPMIVDFQNYKFYTNYFGLMPYLVNQESQDHFAYFDFSKYKEIVDKVDLKALAEYLKQTTMLPYALAQSQEIQSVPVTAQDQKQGVVEKIRLNISVEEMIMQMRLYDKVNSQYFKQSVLGLTDAAMAKVDASAASENQKIEQNKAEDPYEYQTAGMSAEKAEAYRSSKQLYALVNAQLYGNDESDAGDVEEESADTVRVAQEETVSAEQLETDTENAESTENAYITQAECEALKTENSQVLIGDITYCHAEYDVDVLSTQILKAGTIEKSAIFSAESTKLDQIFEQYGQSEQLVDVQRFKALWDKHQSEISQVLTKSKESNPFVVDVGLDQQGRAVKVDYDVAYWVENFGRVKFKADLNAFNYGKGTAINKNDLKNAKSIQEMTKGSMLESMAKGMGKSIGLPEDALSSPKTEKVQKVISLEEQLEQLAIQVYDASNSYLKTYQAVFIMQLSANRPELVKKYSALELNEIARVYAYSYASETVFDPKGKELEDLQRLAEKHHLEYDEQFDNAVGGDVYETVLQVMDESKQRQHWKTLVKQYKQPQAIFAQYYAEQFTKGENLSVTEKALLQSTSQMLAKAFDDSRKAKLTAQSIQNIKAEYSEYIDYDLYRTVYEKIQKQFKK